MKFTLTVVALFSVLGRADAALRNSNAPVITSSNEGESSHDTPKPAEDTHSFLSENSSSTTACGACIGVDQSKVGCGSCIDDRACTGYTGDSIGENSCTGPNSCTEATATIGKNSCNAYFACNEATGYIPDNQCNLEGECNKTHFPALSQYKDKFFGQCQSSDGELYSDVRIMITLLTKNSPEACAQFCRQPSLPSGQVGMQFGHGKCSCLYDERGELPLSSLLPDYTEERIMTSEGPVASGNLKKGWRCYPLKDVNIAHHSLNEPTLTID